MIFLLSAVKLRSAFLAKGTDAFLVVLAVINFAPHGLHSFKGLWTQIVRGREQPELFLEKANHEGRVSGDLSGNAMVTPEVDRVEPRGSQSPDRAGGAHPSAAR